MAWEQRKRTNARLLMVLTLMGYFAAIGLTGCCITRARRERVQGAQCAEAEAEQPVPSAPEYPRFHPVPTRPVFLPTGVEPIPAQSQLHPIDAPELSTVPGDGWHPVRKADAASDEQ